MYKISQQAFKITFINNIIYIIYLYCIKSSKPGCILNLWYFLVYTILISGRQQRCITQDVLKQFFFFFIRRKFSTELNWTEKVCAFVEMLSQKVLT
jgi:hypothetical protein